MNELITYLINGNMPDMMHKKLVKESTFIIFQHASEEKHPKYIILIKER